MQWQADVVSDDPVALVANESMNILGQFCYASSGNCIYMLALSSSCEIGSSSPAIANSDSGAYPIMIECKGLVPALQRYGYVISPFASVDAAIRKSARISFAMPLQNDLISVVRFPTVGAAMVIDQMRNEAIKKIKQKKSRHDEVM